jgi:hypothetical protein
MKHLESFKVFEELKISTYQSAADQLSLKGHDNRAQQLTKHADAKVMKGGEFEYYITKFNNKVTNPKYVFNTIAEMAITEGEGTRLLEVTFQSPKEVISINLTEEKLVIENVIKFRQRKDARRFTAMCNKYIDDNCDEECTKLNINDYYTE